MTHDLIKTFKSPSSDVSVIGVQQIDRVVEVVEQTLLGNTVRFMEKRIDESDPKHRRLGGAPLSLPKIRRNPLIEILAISTGCLNACTYCKTKHARGVLASYPIAELVQQAEEAFAEGVKEVWLTSEDLGAYGRDLPRSEFSPKIVSPVVASQWPDHITLADLLINLVPVIPAGCMLRLGMTNPPYILDQLNEIAAVLRHPRVYTFLHIPVQSGSNHVLGAMRREYTIEEFSRVVDFLTENVNFTDSKHKLTIATDIICGFPNETEPDFRETVALVERYKFPVLYVNQFFARPGTPAASMKSPPFLLLPLISLLFLRVLILIIQPLFLRPLRPLFLLHLLFFFALRPLFLLCLLFLLLLHLFFLLLRLFFLLRPIFFLLCLIFLLLSRLLRRLFLLLLLRPLLRLLTLLRVLFFLLSLFFLLLPPFHLHLLLHLFFVLLPSPTPPLPPKFLILRLFFLFLRTLFLLHIRPLFLLRLLLHLFLFLLFVLLLCLNFLLLLLQLFFLLHPIFSYVSSSYAFASSIVAGALKISFFAPPTERPPLRSYRPYTGREGLRYRVLITETSTDGLHWVGHTKAYEQVSKHTNCCTPSPYALVLRTVTQNMLHPTNPSDVTRMILRKKTLANRPRNRATIDGE
ncbi:unnamed protein product [Dibothriocephalus latus]|uniref:Radical SAM core domain-containing protein n=1 Tax=Dibothriocephalus latus TaxID=60516 RepID=A0A3P7NFJ2_DIBLA|nr:unnamed protein product [Dibothriocephalus latus]